MDKPTSCFHITMPWASAQVAVAPLRCGEVVLREPPLLALPDSFDDDLDLLLNQTSVSSLGQRVKPFTNGELAG